MNRQMKMKRIKSCNLILFSFVRTFKLESKSYFVNTYRYKYNDRIKETNRNDGDLSCSDDEYDMVYSVLFIRFVMEISLYIFHFLVINEQTNNDPEHKCLPLI